MAEDTTRANETGTEATVSAPARRSRRRLRDVQADIEQGKTVTTAPEGIVAPAGTTGTGSLETDAVAAAARADAAGEAFDFDKWFQAQPAEAKQRYATNIVTDVDSRLKSTYGEAYDLLIEAAQLAQAGDTSLLENIKKLSDKDRRKFIFDTAYSIYDQPVPGAEPTVEDASAKRIAELERELGTVKQTIESRDVETARSAYASSRQAELQALVREYPELAYDPTNLDTPAARRVADLIDRAEARSQKAGRAVAYRDVFAEQRAVWGNTPEPPPHIPSTSPAGGPAAAQAPRTEAESRQRMRETIEQYGGSFAAMARALPRGNR